MNFGWVLILCFLFNLSIQIGIPLLPHIKRCMVAYTDDNYETLKLDIELPKLEDQLESQFYQIEIYNTETHQTLYDSAKNGRYRKEMDLDENSIYKICLKLMSERPVSSIITYSSDVEYFESTKTIKVPENLLKEEETKNAYESVVRMEQNMERYQQFLQRKKTEEGENYTSTMEIASRLSVVSYIQISLILIAGVYQFFTIRKFLISRRMI